MAIEENTKEDKHEIPEALYAALPVIRPMDSGDLFEASEQVGHYSMNEESFKALPELKWADIFAMVLTQDQGTDLINRFIIATGSDEGEDPTPLIPS